jgi:hypothetical protein
VGLTSSVHEYCRARMRWIPIFVWLCAATSSVCVQAQAGWVGGQHGEGYSSVAPDALVEFAHRMFTATDTLCGDNASAVVRFESERSAIMLRSGERFDVSTMVLRAVDAAGRFVPRTPFAVEVYFEPGVLERAGQDYDAFIASGTGRARAIFRGLCARDATSPRLEIPITVVP